MISIKSAFHVTHMVRDLNTAMRLYDRIFSAPVYFDGYHEGENRDAAFVTVSDAYIELFAPRDANDAQPASNGGRYIQRSGEGLANFGWLISSDVAEAIRYCEAQGYPVVPVAGMTTAAFFVHPRHAQGMMLEFADSTIPEDPRAQPGWAARWRDEHPLGIERMHAVSFAVRDLDAAIRFLQTVAGATLVHQGENAAGDRESAYLWVVDHMIEVMRGTSPETPIGRFIEANGPRIHSVAFRVRDPRRASGFLDSLGLRNDLALDGRSVAVDPRDLLGARYVFTDTAIPNDPRGA